MDDAAAPHLLLGSRDTLRGYGTGAGCFVRLRELTAHAEGIELRCHHGGDANVSSAPR